jgi:hypothetical protein
MHDSPAPRAVKITIIERFFISDDFIIASVSMGTTDGDIGEAFGDFSSSHSATLPITKPPQIALWGFLWAWHSHFLAVRGDYRLKRASKFFE